MIFIKYALEQSTHAISRHFYALSGEKHPVGFYTNHFEIKITGANSNLPPTKKFRDEKSDRTIKNSREINGTVFWKFDIFLAVW